MLPDSGQHRGWYVYGTRFLPDQYAFLLRCGITTVEMQDGADPAAWQKAADRFSFGYRPSVLKEPVLSGLRRTIRLGVPRDT